MNFYLIHTKNTKKITSDFIDYVTELLSCNININLQNHIKYFKYNIIIFKYNLKYFLCRIWHI